MSPQCTKMSTGHFYWWTVQCAFGNSSFSPAVTHLVTRIMVQPYSNNKHIPWKDIVGWRNVLCSISEMTEIFFCVISNNAIRDMSSEKKKLTQSVGCSYKIVSVMSCYISWGDHTKKTSGCSSTEGTFMLRSTILLCKKFSFFPCPKLRNLIFNHWNHSNTTEALQTSL